MTPSNITPEERLCEGLPGPGWSVDASVGDCLDCSLLPTQKILGVYKCREEIGREKTSLSLSPLFSLPLSLYPASPPPFLTVDVNGCFVFLPCLPCNDRTVSLRNPLSPKLLIAGVCCHGNRSKSVAVCKEPMKSMPYAHGGV